MFIHFTCYLNVCTTQHHHPIFLFKVSSKYMRYCFKEEIWGENILRASCIFQYTSVGLFSWLDTTILKDNVNIGEACGNYTNCYETQEKSEDKMNNKNYFQIVFEEHAIPWYSINLICNITIIFILYMQKQRLRRVNIIWKSTQLVNERAGILTLF